VSWEHKQLCQVGEVTTGSTPKTSSPEFYNGDVPFVTPADLDTGLRSRDCANFDNKRRLRKRVFCQSVRLLVSCIGTLGKVGIAGRELATNNRLIRSCSTRRKCFHATVITRAVDSSLC
jgi:type I restriction enzyme S subunit